jgi:DNA (cytosine-5)-methyltransferase 1
MAAYYNEIDPFAAQWLRNLIVAGHIAPGDVDTRSIADVRADDLRPYTQCHFFAGIAGWSYALRLAGWPDDRAVWTGSCPCQPLSSAGQRKGHADERHLWPAFYRLIAECRPAAIFGEQVASADGREWLAGVRADLEHLGYACGAADLPAASVGAPHIRQRLFWVADADGGNASAARLQRGGQYRKQPQDSESGVRLGDTAGAGLQEQWGEYRPRGERHRGLVGFAVQAGVPEWNGPTVAIDCSDGPRRVSAQPNSFPLAHGVPGRVGRLRAYGNAIVPQVAARFVEAVMSAVPARQAAE